MLNIKYRIEKIVMFILGGICYSFGSILVYGMLALLVVGIFLFVSILIGN